jgi:hypothetical protein
LKSNRGVVEPDWWAITDNESKAARLHTPRRVRHRRRLQVRENIGGRSCGGRISMPHGEGGGGWPSFEEMMKQVLPGYRLLDISPDHPVFHSFFEIKDIENFPQAYICGHPIFRGIFEDNDPSKRLMMVVNYNTDISQYWEWSGSGFRPFDDTNEAYKLGVNYLMYGLTH